MKNYQLLISTALNIAERQVESTLNLLNEGATIPFISRYRKEMTGGLDEVQIGNIKDYLFVAALVLQLTQFRGNAAVINCTVQLGIVDRHGYSSP